MPELFQFFVKLSVLRSLCFVSDLHFENVSLIKDEPILIVTKQGMVIKFNSSDVSATSRATSGVKGIDLKPVKELLSNLSIPIIYSGGITSLDDLKVLYDLGTDYVVIGSALYKGVINFEDTIQFQK